MNGRLQKTSQKLYAVVDWFIPPRIKADGDLIQGARMFLFSHLFGPFLGHTISLYVLFVQEKADLDWWIFFGAITAFWPFPFILRATGWYLPLALVSIQNLIFCIFWGCYQYGGISSPILPWMITVPLLAFFYLPTRKTRIMVSCQILANLMLFYFIYNRFGFSGDIPLSKLSGLGMVSTFCAGVYVSMMALYYSNIVSSQAELEQEIQRHLATARQLREATEQAERATQAKSEFLAKMSHELRTPLNAIIGYSEILIEDAVDNDEKSEDLARIHGAGKRLLELINDLLDLSKLEAGKTDVNPMEFALDKLVDEVVAQWREPIAAQGNEFHVDCPADPGLVLTDALRLRQALSNLLSNAAKFTRNGRIMLSVANREGRISLAVRDTGIGIDPGRIGTLFETFGSRESETSSKYDEHPGLGLPLTQRLCRLLGGDVSVDSEPGHGACFTIGVPARLASRAEIDALPALPVSAAHQRKDIENAILVIDEDSAARDLLNRILIKEGYVPALAANTVDGITRAREHVPAIIILDVRMTAPDGWQALRVIRQDPMLRGCKVVLLTIDDDFAKGRALGADAHLLKPIDRDELLQSLDAFGSTSPQNVALQSA